MTYAKYGSEQRSQITLNGVTWHKVWSLGPWTHFTWNGPVTVQAIHTTMWGVHNGHMFAVKHISRQINPF